MGKKGNKNMFRSTVSITIQVIFGDIFIKISKQ